eukprot:12902137-Prorocentrum_lima.AAC.1
MSDPTSSADSPRRVVATPGTATGCSALPDVHVATTPETAANPAESSFQEITHFSTPPPGGELLFNFSRDAHRETE